MPGAGGRRGRAQHFSPHTLREEIVGEGLEAKGPEVCPGRHLLPLHRRQPRGVDCGQPGLLRLHRPELARPAHPPRPFPGNTWGTWSNTGRPGAPGAPSRGLGHRRTGAGGAPGGQDRRAGSGRHMTGARPVLPARQGPRAAGGGGPHPAFYRHDETATTAVPRASWRFIMRARSFAPPFGSPWAAPPRGAGTSVSSHPWRPHAVAMRDRWWLGEAEFLVSSRRMPGRTQARRARRLPDSEPEIVFV